MSETSEWNAFNNAVIDEFRANEGNVGGGFAGAPMILITHTGAKSGDERNRLFRAQADLMPNFDEYATKTTRVIPVVVIERA